ncbi:hypothetical protein SELMODRAFT_426445 [Selaginella moellendorffii]|uniref:Jacalin-type lectin domain-containing protein n=1 Tax=Selaginella moellendorffii TaxID=88036 RepID=D8SWD7_SELML|nr:uncharacterized protein LOC9630730 [Selaginella moellendorffii]EFJ11275.1 hypothetical protein SELMODRAFT_426445 [Selaginella moellendorffii]|eukprot:XP_002987700.1 uncharacterized protein LOC9630730 [Selaginella moellendorffii]
MKEMLLALVLLQTMLTISSSSRNIAAPDHTIGSGIIMVGSPDLGDYGQFLVSPGKFINRIMVWRAKSCIKSIALWSIDGSFIQVGRSKERGPLPVQEFEFQRGETIVYLMMHSNRQNDWGNRLGWIEFRTNFNRFFSCGNLPGGLTQQITPPVHSGVIVGAAFTTGGTGGDTHDVNSFAIFFLKNWSAAQLQDVIYASPGYLETILETPDPPSRLEREVTIESTWTVDSLGVDDFIWTTTHTRIPTVRMSSLDGIPYWTWTDTITSSLQDRKSTTLVWTRGWDICMGPISLYLGRGITLTNFTGSMVISFSDGDSFVYPTSGRYSGQQFSGFGSVCAVDAESHG